jgi:hypothetical protein
MWLVVLAAAAIALVAWRALRSDFDSTVQGAVTIDGELVNRGTVVFHPVGRGAPAYGDIGRDGTYALRVGQGDLRDADGGQLASGDYLVTVMVTSAPAESPSDLPMPGPRVTAAKYREKSTTDLKVSVKPGPNVIPLDLDGASTDPPPPEDDEPTVEGEEARPADAATEEVESSKESSVDEPEGDAR